MKVLILTNSLVGLYQFRKELIKRLILENKAVVISAPNGDRANEFIDFGCKFIETDIDRRGVNPIYDLKLFFNYMRIIKTEKPDVVLMYTVKPNTYGGIACRLLKKRYIPNVTGLGSAMQKKGIVFTIIKNLYKVAFKSAKCVFFQNSTNMKLLSDWNIVKDNAVLIPGSGVNIDDYTPIPFPQDSGKIRFLFIARIYKEKGIDEYLNAADIIRKRYSNTEFHVCGGCEEDYEELLRKKNESGDIVYHGEVKNIKDVISDMHCTVNPSYHEGMSNVLLESSAVARPCLCSNIPGCKEIVDDGKTGFLFEAQSMESLVSAIEKFLNMNHAEMAKMGENARSKVCREFDRNIVIEKYLGQING